MADQKDMDALRLQLQEALSACERLRTENAELRRQLGMPAESSQEIVSPPHLSQQDPNESDPALHLSPAEKIELFRSLFRGRTDVYPLRWESKTNNRSGYSPACANEWRAGICEKPKIKCAECMHRAFLPVSDQVLYDHLAGKHTIGVYPLLADDSCHWVAVDFDDEDWRADVAAFAQSCRDLQIPGSIEISRSSNGADVWIFFATAIPAALARQLGTALITHTCAQSRQLKLTSYDRLFPSQDSMPKGGFGNLIALPLQKKPREQGASIFVDEALKPYPDQWAYLASVKRVTAGQIEAMFERVGADGSLLDVGFIGNEDEQEPWKTRLTASRQLPQPLPATLNVTLANKLYFNKSDLPQPLANRLIRLAAFQNPEFYSAQRMRFPVWDKPRVIGCAENFPHHIALPRGCLDGVGELLDANGIALGLRDERFTGTRIAVKFSGTLRPDQKQAVTAMLKHDLGVLSAPTAFGKTVTAAAIIARRKVNTLVLVHRTELLNQWIERLQSFLAVEKGVIGVIGGGKRKPSGQIDVAVMQSLVRAGEVSELVEGYGQVIVDECHHVSAVSFEDILKRVKARYVLGLTATPVRRDGHQPIVVMQCGPIRHQVRQPEGALTKLEVLPRHCQPVAGDDADQIQTVFNRLAEDEARNRLIANDAIAAYQAGRHIVVLSERTEHVERLSNLLTGQVENLLVMYGRMGKKQRREVIDRLNGLPDDVPRILIATGRLIGEGFDHARLDTLMLAMPISWKGTLQQYAGRLHRQHVSKTSIRIYDYVDTGFARLSRMWDKRRRGYRAMGYVVASSNEEGQGTLLDSSSLPELAEQEV